ELGRRGSLFRYADLQRAIDLPAAHAARDDLPAFGLERAQLVRQPEAEIEKAMVDAAQLPNEPVWRSERLRAREACHAVRQGVESVPATCEVRASLAATGPGSGTAMLGATRPTPARGSKAVVRGRFRVVF